MLLDRDTKKYLDKDITKYRDKYQNKHISKHKDKLITSTKTRAFTNTKTKYIKNLTRSTFNSYLRCSPCTTPTESPAIVTLPQHCLLAARTRSHAAPTPQQPALMTPSRCSHTAPHANFMQLPRRPHAAPALLHCSCNASHTPSPHCHNATPATQPQRHPHAALTQPAERLLHAARRLNASFTMPAHRSHTASTPKQSSSNAAASCPCADACSPHTALTPPSRLCTPMLTVPTLFSILR